MTFQIERIKKSLLTAVLMPLSFATYAGGEVVEVIEIEEYTWFHPVVSVSGGLASARIGDPQSIYTPAINGLYIFDVHQQRQNRGTWGVFAGNILYGEEGRELHYGLSYYQLPSKTVSGSLDEWAGLRTFEFNHYQYTVRGQQLLFEMKLTKLVHKGVHPYFEAGAGWGFNRTHSFSTVNNDLITPTFADNKNNAFVYRFGVGLDFDLMPYVRLGVGYRFVNWGRADTGEGFVNALDLPLPRPLQQENIYSNGAEAQLTVGF